MIGKKSDSGVVVNRNSWTSTTLGKAYDVRDGTHDSPKYQNDGYPLVTSKNLKENYLDLNNVQYISETDYLKINERSFVSQGDVLLAMIGTIGNPVVIIEKPNFAIKNVALFKVPEDQDSFFLKYYLQSNYVKEKMQVEAKGTTQKFVGLGYLRSFPITLPPLSEQKRIVAILDEAFAGINQTIANTEKNLANARELFDSCLSLTFSYKDDSYIETTLGENCLLITDGKHGDCENDSNSGYYFASAKDVRNSTILFDQARQITKSCFEETHRRTNLKAGDICMVNTGATIGRTSIAPNDERTSKTTFQKSVAVIKTIPEKLNNKYCCYLLQADLKKLTNTSSGTAVKNLLLGDLKKHSCHLPKSIATQLTIVGQTR